MQESNRKDIKKKQSTIHKLKGFIGKDDKEMNHGKNKELINAYIREYKQDYKEINYEKTKSKELINVEIMRKIDSDDPFVER